MSKSYMALKGLNMKTVLSSAYPVFSTSVYALKGSIMLHGFSEFIIFQDCGPKMIVTQRMTYIPYSLHLQEASLTPWWPSWLLSWNPTSLTHFCRKEILICLEGKSMTPPQGFCYLSFFPDAPSLRPLKNFFQLTQRPSRALNLASSVAPGTSEIQGHHQVCYTRRRGLGQRQVMQTLIVRLL